MVWSRTFPLDVAALIVHQVDIESHSSPEDGLFAPLFLNKDARRVLRTLLLVNRGWYRLARPLLRKKVHIKPNTSTGMCAISFINLSASEDELDNIESLEMDFGDLQSRIPSKNLTVSMYDVLCATVFKKLPNLRALCLSGYQPSPNRPWPLTCAALRSLDELEYLIVRRLSLPESPSPYEELRSLATEMIINCCITLRGFGLLGHIPGNDHLWQALADLDVLDSLHIDAADPSEFNWTEPEEPDVPASLTRLHLDLSDGGGPEAREMWGAVMSTIISASSRTLELLVVTGRGATPFYDPVGTASLPNLRKCVLPVFFETDAAAAEAIDIVAKSDDKLESLTTPSFPGAYLTLVGRLQTGEFEALREVIIRNAPPAAKGEWDRDFIWESLESLLTARGISLFRERRVEKA